MTEALPEPTQEVLAELELAQQQFRIEDFRREGVSKMRDMIMRLAQGE